MNTRRKVSGELREEEEDKKQSWWSQVSIGGNARLRTDRAETITPSSTSSLIPVLHAASWSWSTFPTIRNTCGNIPAG